MATDITLYWCKSGGPSMKVRICLAEKEIFGYNSKPICTIKKENKSDKLKEINPRGQVPAFKHGDVIVNESLAICLYLENAFKNQGTKLLPDNPSQQALVFQRMFEADSIVKKAIRQELPAEKRKLLLEELTTWEGYLAQHEGPYLAGTDFTLADAAFFPFFAILVRERLPLKGRFPRLAIYYGLVKERPSVMTSWPLDWKTKYPFDPLSDV